jgi:hypothetical protein
MANAEEKLNEKPEEDYYDSISEGYDELYGDEQLAKASIISG